MDDTVPYLRTQTELLADIEALQRDPTNLRWSDAEIYRAINQAMMTWFDKVKLPRAYTITDGFVASTYGYDLPSYMRPPIFPQLSRRIPFDEYRLSESTTSTWQDVPGWETEPNSSGGLTLKLLGAPRTMDARVLWYAPNSRVPLTIPTTSGSTAANATSLLIGSAVDVDDTGYVKVDAEYMSYSGVTRAASTTTLLNLVRALNGSAAAIHNTASNVTWCVAVDTMRLYELLYDQVRSILNALPLTDGGTHEVSRYEKMMGYYKQLADQYWPIYKPVRKTHNLTLSRRALSLRL